MIGDTNRDMNVDRFALELPGLFEDFPTSEHPQGQRFDDIVDEVPNLAEENNLALLNLAASLMDAGESYVEAGTYMGASLIAAARGNEGKDLVGIDDLSFAGVEVRERTLPPGSRATLEANLERFEVQGATIIEGDAHTLLREGALGDRRVGVYYYDASHSYENQLEGLRLIEPYLAASGLLIVDDSDWEDVGRATRDYLASQPRARMLVEIGGAERGQPWWWEGVMVLAWE
jgi:predicted O-methyltransferase YrrM